MIFSTLFNIYFLLLSTIFLKIKATPGDTRFGEKDFDDRLVAHFAQELRKNTRKLWWRINELFESRIVKRTLFFSMQTSLEIDALLDCIFTRACFEKLNQNFFKSILEPVEEVLQDKDPDIILVGESTKISRI